MGMLKLIYSSLLLFSIQALTQYLPKAHSNRLYFTNGNLSRFEFGALAPSTRGIKKGVLK
jgi:hypothetical protein